MAKPKFNFDFRAEVKEPGSTEGDPWIFINFYDPSLPEARIIIEYKTDDYNDKYDLAEELEETLNRLIKHL